MTAEKTVQKTIQIDRIDADPDQPRKLFDEAKIDELAASMKLLGQLQPVSVRYDTSTKRYTLIMGERRWRAAQHETPVEVDGGHLRVWLRRRNMYYPCAEHALVAAPATVADKQNASFGDVWASAQDAPSQLSLLA